MVVRFSYRLSILPLLFLSWNLWWGLNCWVSLFWEW